MSAGLLSLRPEVRWVHTGDGCVVVGDTGLTTIRGDRIAEWLDRLAPALDGRTDLDRLTAALPAGQAGGVRTLIGGLIERGFVRLLDQTRPPTAVVVIGTGPVADALRSALRAADVPVTAADDGPVRRVRVLDRAERGGHPETTADVELLVVGDQLWIGGGLTGVDLGDAWLRSVDRAAAPVGDDRPRDALIAMAVAQVVHRLTVDPSPAAADAGRLVVWRDTTLVTRHRVLPHPLRGQPAGPEDPRNVARRMHEVAAADPLKDDRFSLLAAQCADDRFGLIGEPTEADYRQVPLPVTTATVADPCRATAPAEDGPALMRVHGVGWDFTEARFDCALTALARYAGRCAERMTARPAGTAAWGVRLIATGDHVGAPIALTGTRTDAAVAAGLSWSQALQRAATRLLRDRAVAALATGRGTIRCLDPADVDADVDDERIRYARAMLTAGGRQPGLHLVTGIWPSLDAEPPVVLALDGDRPVALRVAADLTTAIRDTLRDCLLAQQSADDPAADYRPPSLDGLPIVAAQRLPRQVDPVPAVDPVAALARLGRYAISLLDHDHELAARIPFLIKVVAHD